MFQFTELSHVKGQKGDTKFIDFLKIGAGNVDEDVQKKIRVWFKEESDISNSGNALHMIAENYPTIKNNLKILDMLPGKTCIIDAINQIPADCEYPETLILLAWNKKQSETSSLAKCLELKVGTIVIVTFNVGL